MPETALPFIENRLLFGSDRTRGILAIEPLGDDGMRRWIRTTEGVRTEDQEFRPPILLSEPVLLEGSGLKYEIEELEGEGELRFLARLVSWKDLTRARRHLQQVTGRTARAAGAPYLLLTDPVHAHMLTTGQTLFEGMRFEDLRRLQLDIETTCTPGYDFPNPQRDGDRIVAIALADSTGWEEVLMDTGGGEKALLETFVARFLERDPDVVEGHNIFRFDLPYIAARCARHGISLRLGRDGAVMASRNSRATIGDRTISYPKAEIRGRHVIDTFFLVLHYDISSRSLPGFGLKEVARHFGLASDDREYIEGYEVSSMIDRDPERLRRYAADDVRETRELSRILSPSWFVQAQMMPYSYQNVVVRGNATRINALLIRESLYRRRAIPLPEPSRSFAGGYTDLFAVGVARGVWHCDVQSLYPSIMLRFGYVPARDREGVFRDMLADLRRFRLEAKRLAAEAAAPADREHYQALQSTFKILINSFYGYLGFGQGNFNDFDAAEKVAAKGREILRRMIDVLAGEGSRIIEIDTDGIYFVPPAPGDDRVEQRLSAALKKALPEGIEVEFDGRFRAMFSYKMKNYALLDEEGRLSIKGAALKSRGLEPFQRRFMEEMLRCLLEGRPEAVADLYESYCRQIEQRRWPIRMFAKTETLQDSLETYSAKVQAGKRNRSAAYELALESGRAYQQGDQVAYYVTGNDKRAAAHRNAKLVAAFDESDRDENVEYYLAKLRSLYRKFEPFFSEEGMRLRDVKDETASPEEES